MTLATRALAAGLALAATGALATLLVVRQRRDVPPPPAPRVASQAPPIVEEAVPIRRGDTLESLLVKSGVARPSVTEMIAAARRVFDVRKFRVGAHLTVGRSQGLLESVGYVIDPDHELRLSRAEGSYQAAVVPIPGEIRVVPVCGSLHGSLFESMEQTGERPELAMQLAEIFGWDLDFYSDPQPGDRFCMMLEKKEYQNGQPPTYRRILAASYDNAGTLYEGYLFSGDGGPAGYYSRDGHSLQAAFLRSPMKFEARISSHFSGARLHPILRITRPHLGTDYAAPTGTSVQSIASGSVTFAGRNGDAGNMITVRHANGYESTYMHLSRILVRKGQTVEQGSRIGEVGATGLATGPHLDFRLRKNGQYLNFERLKPPRATQIAAAQMTAFGAERDRLAAMMNPASNPALHVAGTAPTPRPVTAALD